ncbi:TPA: hypothetical protein ACYLN4_002722 [Burkholderia lata]
MATSLTFDFPNHLVEEKYPESGTRIQLGNSYVFATPPTAPEQRTFVLSFETMWRGINADGTVDIATNPLNNMGLLKQFYETYRLYKTFQYKHPWLGTLNVRFSKPLEMPKGKKGADGWSESFSIEFVEMP